MIQENTIALKLQINWFVESQKSLLIVYDEIKLLSVEYQWE